MNDVIRRARVDDSKAMYAIKIAAHTGDVYVSLIPGQYKDKFLRHYTWSSEGEERFHNKLQKMLSEMLTRVYVIEHAGQICGYIMAHRQSSQEHWILTSLFVTPAAQGAGLGSQLIDHFLQSTRSQSELLVIAGNKAAIRLYQKYGYQLVDETEGSFYGAPLAKMRRAIDIRII
jgi:ribosomal protein S18 acetylase RimI-like enzyme